MSHLCTGVCVCNWPRPQVWPRRGSMHSPLRLKIKSRLGPRPLAAPSLAAPSRAAPLAARRAAPLAAPSLAVPSRPRLLWPRPPWPRLRLPRLGPRLLWPRLRGRAFSGRACSGRAFVAAPSQNPVIRFLFLFQTADLIMLTTMYFLLDNSIIITCFSCGRVF
jgi:hypothetical protein